MLPNKIKSLQHPIVKDLVKVRKNKPFRYEKKSLVISGNKTIKEIAKKKKIKILLFASDEIPSISCEKKIQVTKEIIIKISGIQSPENLLAVVDLPKEQDLTNKKYLLILDRLSDPGNVGTLLRTALAFGWEGVIYTPETTDPFNDKSLRSSKGACLFLPYQFMTYEQIRQMMNKTKKELVVADIEGKAVHSFPSSTNVALVLSSEAHGLSSLGEKGRKITIPMTKKIESLNVSIAGAILMQKLGPKI